MSSNIKLFLVNVLREDGKIWQEAVIEPKEEEFIVCEFNGPIELTNQYFHVSNIKYSKKNKL